MGGLQVTELYINVQFKFIMEINRGTKKEEISRRTKNSGLLSHPPQQDVFLSPTPWGPLGQMAPEAGLLARQPGPAAEPFLALGLTQHRQLSVPLRTWTETVGRVASRTQRGLSASWPPRLCQGMLGTEIGLLL